MAPQKLPNLKLDLPQSTQVTFSRFFSEEYDAEKGMDCVQDVDAKHDEINMHRNRNRPNHMYLAAASCLLSGISTGMVYGYTAPAGPKMSLPNSRLQLDDNEFTWFGSIATLGALVGGLVGGPMSDKFGRGASLVVCGAPCFLGLLLVSYGTSIPMLLIGRALSGSYCGLSCVVAPQYLVEISTIATRGFIGSLFEISWCVGCLLVLVIGAGSDMGWRWLAIVSSASVVLMMAAMALMPESPRWLIQKGRISESIKSALYLHGNLEEMKEEILAFGAQRSLTDLSNCEDDVAEKGFEFCLLKQREYYLPFMYSIILMLIQQFSGTSAITFYVVDMFQSSGTTISPTLSAIILNILGLMCAFAGGMLMDRCGRKKLLLVSGAGCTIGLFVMGLNCYLQDTMRESFTKHYGWIGIVALSTSAGFFEIGLGPVPWMIIPEIVPQRARGFGGSCAIAVNWASAFVVTKTFNSMVSGIGADGTYWFYSSIGLLGCVFTWLCIPETKGQSFANITRIFAVRDTVNALESPGKYEYEEIPPMINVN